VDAGDLAERFFRGHDVALAEEFGGEEVGRAGEALQVRAGGEDAAGRDAERFGERGDGEGEIQLQRSFGDGERTAQRGEAGGGGVEAVGTRGEPEREAAGRAGEYHRCRAACLGQGGEAGAGESGAGGVRELAGDGGEERGGLGGEEDGNGQNRERQLQVICRHRISVA